MGASLFAVGLSIVKGLGLIHEEVAVAAEEQEVLEARCGAHWPRSWLFKLQGGLPIKINIHWFLGSLEHFKAEMVKAEQLKIQMMKAH